MIIINGRNAYPSDIERVVIREGGGALRPGCAVACQLNPTSVAVACEVYPDEECGEEKARKIARVVRGECGVDVARLILLKKGSIPKTTSGKLKRVRNMSDSMCNQSYVHFASPQGA